MEDYKFFQLDNETLSDNTNEYYRIKLSLLYVLIYFNFFPDSLTLFSQ